MSYEQICSVATELIVGSLNVNDTIRATLELLKRGAAGLPASPFCGGTAERFKEDCICDKHHSPFIHHACQTWTFIIKFAHGCSSFCLAIHFFGPLSPSHSFSPSPSFLSLSSPSFFAAHSAQLTRCQWYPCASDAARMSLSCFCCCVVHWKMLSSSVTMEAVH